MPNDQSEALELNNLVEEVINEELSESGFGIGVEADVDDEQEALEPFNPEEISIQQKVIAMDAILRRLKQKTINLSPSFQRKLVWNSIRKSRLIESIMLNIPLPMFYVAADEEGVWEVVDGLQRLSTIRDFLIGDNNGEFLKLNNLEFLGDRFNGKTFKYIENDPKEQKLVNKIYETELRFTVINPGTPEAVKRNIFKRINTGGMPLTAQEIRHALYEGQSSELLKRLVVSDIFIKIAGKRIDDSRMGASELVLRLISFMILDRSYYKLGMDSWLSNTMRVLNCFPDPTSEEVKKIFVDADSTILKIRSIEEIENKFNLAMQRSDGLFDGHAFRKSLPGTLRKSPINKSLFEVWGNILANLTESEYTLLLKHKKELIKEYSLLLNNLDFTNAISRHSASAKGINASYSNILNVVNIILQRYES